MEDRRQEPVPFDEAAALAELDGVHQQIERCRIAREAASERFEAFIRSFQEPTPATPDPWERTPADTAPEVQETPPPPGPAGSYAGASPTPAPESPATASRAVATPVGVPMEARTSSSGEATSSAAAPHKKRVRMRAVAAGVLLLPALAALGVWGWRQQASRPGPGPSGNLPIQRPAQPPIDPSAGPPDVRPVAPPAVTLEPAPQTPAAARQLELEITTTRGVWVRVLSDGERVLERELPADARVPVTAGQTIVIRTGDAGAVLVSVNGAEPEPLGREGQVMTRTFTLGGEPR